MRGEWYVLVCSFALESLKEKLTDSVVGQRSHISGSN